MSTQDQPTPFFQSRRTRNILAAMEERLAGNGRHLLISGPTNTGRSTLLQHFSERHPPDLTADPERAQWPVLLLHTPPGPEEALLDAALKRLNAPFTPSAQLHLKQLQFIRIAREIRLRVLALDDLQRAHPAMDGHMFKFIDRLLAFAEATSSKIVATIDPSAAHVIAEDPRTSDRFEIFGLPPMACDADFMQLVDHLYDHHGITTRPGDRPYQELHRSSAGHIGRVAAAISKLATPAHRKPRPPSGWDRPFWLDPP